MTPRATTSTTGPTTSKKSKRRRRKSSTTTKNKRRKALHARTPNLIENDHEKACTKSHPMPEDYIFVPKGDPYITRHCKSRTKDDDKIVYIVYDSKFKRQLGIRVPSHIHTAVLESASETAADRASATLVRDRRDSVKARALLLTVFPGIPLKCLDTIVQHAFLKGSGRVGRISTRTDREKAKLAVEAHIRHEHTEYERLMEKKGMQRDEARKVVWEEVKRVRDEWAGKIGDVELDESVEEEENDNEEEKEEEEEEGKEEEEEQQVKEIEVIDLT